MIRRRALLGGIAVLLASCSSPPPELYTLAALPGTPARIPARSVELRHIGLAGYLDRPEIVRSAADYRLRLSERERWGEPLGGMFQRVFIEDLVQRLPGTAVYSDTGAITARPDLVVEVDVQRFDTDEAGPVVLLAQLAVRPDDGRPASVTDILRVEVAPSATGTPALVAAMSAALAQLADQVAIRLGGANRTGS